jgi:hypothetical protein
MGFYGFNVRAMNTPDKGMPYRFTLVSFLTRKTKNGILLDASIRSRIF